MSKISGITCHKCGNDPYIVWMAESEDEEDGYGSCGTCERCLGLPDNIRTEPYICDKWAKKEMLDELLQKISKVN
jgi:hypothetical protein